MKSSLFTKIPNNDKLNIKYDIHGDSHLVYVGNGDNVRRITFQSEENAINFYKSISLYNSLKESI